MLFQDFFDSLRSYSFWLYSALIELEIKYKSTAFGPFWMIASTLLYVALLGSLYGRVLGAGGGKYIAHLAIGLVAWLFISMIIVQSCSVLHLSREIILSGRTRLTDYVLRMITGEGLKLLHNLIIVVGVFVFTAASVTFSSIWVLIFTVPLALLFLLGVAVFLSIVGARFRDVGELVQSVMRVMFFVTPIVWSPELHARGKQLGAFNYSNPFYYVIEVVRAPVIDGHVPWFAIAIMSVMTLIVWAFATVVYSRGRPVIALWI